MVFLTIGSSLTVHAVEGEIIGPETIFKEANQVLAMSHILPLYESTLGDVTVQLEGDDFTGNGNVPGIYDVILEVAETEMTKTIQINVRQTIGDVIAVVVEDGVYRIICHKSTTLTSTQIIGILVNVQYVTTSSTTQITILTNTYAVNADAPGEYVFEFHLAETSGVEDTYLVNVQVNDTVSITPDIVIEEPEPVPYNWIPWFYALFSIGAVASLIMLKNKKKKGR